MKITITRQDLLAALQAIIGVVDSRHVNPSLSNMLVTAEKGALTITGTDLEVEMVADTVPADIHDEGTVLIPGRKLFDITRGLTADAVMQISADDGNGENIRIQSSRSRFRLAGMTAAGWPEGEKFQGHATIRLNAGQLKSLLDRTHFAMGVKDVRYYLNGALFEISSTLFRCVATNGHRLALAEVEQATGVTDAIKAIVPAKAVTLLMRLLDGIESDITMQITENHIRLQMPGLTMTSKLISGKYPDYDRVIPVGLPLRLTAKRRSMQDLIARASILANEDRGIRMAIGKGSVEAVAINRDREESKDQIEVDYDQDPMEIGFNAQYMNDVLASISTDEVTIDLKDENSTMLIQPAGASNSRYVLMPMRL